MAICEYTGCGRPASFSAAVPQLDEKSRYVVCHVHLKDYRKVLEELNTQTGNDLAMHWMPIDKLDVNGDPIRPLPVWIAEPVWDKFEIKPRPMPALGSVPAAKTKTKASIAAVAWGWGGLVAVVILGFMLAAVGSGQAKMAPADILLSAVIWWPIAAGVIGAVTWVHRKVDYVKSILSAAIGGLLLLGVLTGCGNPGGTAQQTSPTIVTAPSTVTATVTARSTVTATQTQTAPETETVEPRQTPSAQPPSGQPPSGDAEIRAEVSTAYRAANTYWDQVFAGWQGNQGEPVYWEWPGLFRGDGFYDSASGDSTSCDGTADPLNAGFCSYRGTKSGIISWDMARFRQEEARYGDAPIYVIVAHEVGHAAQHRFWFDNEGGATPDPDDSVPYEQQADCLAGATLTKAEQDGYLVADPGDLNEIVASISNMESGTDHGDAADRLAAFMTGYHGDIESCLYNRGVPPDYASVD